MKRRTTLTLPSNLLLQAKRIARSRQTTLSAVVSELVSAGLRLYAAPKRSEQVLRSYRKAFAGFSNEELLLLDGVMLEPVESQ